MAITSRRVTLEEFLELPEAKPALEFHRGVISQKVSPKAYHGRIQYKFAELVNQYGEPAKVAMAFTETRATFGGSSYVPDVGVYRWERLPRTEQGKLAIDFTVPWDLVLEVMSPGQSREALLERCRWYVDNGVALALLAELDDESVSVVRSGGDVSVLRGDARISLDNVLPGLELTPGQLFETLYPDRRA